MINCDPVTGACLLPDSNLPVGNDATASALRPVVHYVGDPMCSWCWGISPTVREVAAFCAERSLGLAMTMGGLRAGGGDPWNDAFKNFLRQEWRHIGQVTGQPFGFTLLDAAHFDYDTEPACRAVVTMQMLQRDQGLAPSTALDFFAAVQRKFYVEGEDPKVAAFYAGICAGLGVDFDAFRTLFDSDAAHEAVRAAFMRCRRWGVRSFPTLLLERAGTITTLATGFVTTEQVLARLRELRAA